MLLELLVNLVVANATFSHSVVQVRKLEDHRMRVANKPICGPAEAVMGKQPLSGPGDADKG